MPVPDPPDPPQPSTAPEAVALAAAQYAVLFAPDQVVELRALGVRRGGRPHTEAGFYDGSHLADLAKAALAVSPYARGVYATLNPLRPEVLARRCRRVEWAGDGELAKDADVVARRWLLVDVDPVRDPHVSATDGEKRAAWGTAAAVRDWLTGRGWPAPVVGDSGNGYHLLYRVAEPAADGGRVGRALAALAARFDTPAVKVDRVVGNPARLVKLPGTLARKGDSVPDRPHRRAWLLEVPGP